jgi:hypothetical protein
MIRGKRDFGPVIGRGMEPTTVTAQIQGQRRLHSAGFVALARLLLPALILAALAGGASGTRATVEAQAPPATYYGTAAASDRIEAKYNGTTCASAVAGANGFWSMSVVAGGACGVLEGGSLAFFRNGVDTTARETFRVAGVPASIASGVNVGSGALAPVPPAVSEASFLGATPPPGGAALLVTLRRATAEEIRLALTGVGCRLQMLAVIGDDGWLVYIDGAPAAVNARFPASLAETTPFYVRC